jgi:hypothetical protein
MYKPLPWKMSKVLAWKANRLLPRMGGDAVVNRMGIRDERGCSST